MVTKYIAKLKNLCSSAIISDSVGGELEHNDAFNIILEEFNRAKREGNSVFFIGNGGSASIASHMSIDFWKNGGIKAVSFNDGSLLTCLSNDFGYEKVFSKPMEMFANEKDILVAISSSGNSTNIVNAARSAKAKKIFVFTLSGFTDENKLRKIGDINLYLASSSYGLVETGHSTILHFLLDTLIERGNNVK